LELLTAGKVLNEAAVNYKILHLTFVTSFVAAILFSAAHVSAQPTGRRVNQRNRSSREHLATWSPEIINALHTPRSSSRSN